LKNFLLKKKMKIILFSLLSFFIVSILANTCDPAKGINTFNSDCTNSGNPYCVAVGFSPILYDCRACVTNCDCELDEYCSQHGSSAGQCKKFQATGNSCRNLSPSQLADPTIPSSWKCAEFYTDPSGQQLVDQAGACIAGTCQYCSYRGTSGGLSNCDPQSGTQVERICVYPGILVNTHAASWSPGPYYENPDLVWWAIFFCLLVLIIVIQSITCICLITK